MGDREDRQKSKQREMARQEQEAITAVANTPEGQVFLRALMKRCHFTSSTISGNMTTGEINTSATLFNEAQRRIYLDIRRNIPNTILRKIETPTQGEEK